MNDLERKRRNGWRVYGEWAGNERGVLERADCCIEGIYPYHAMIESQCSRKRGFGPGGLYCKQHGKQKDTP